MVNLIELPINAIEAAEETPFLANYFPNIFAEALVPLNPQRWPAYLAGSAMASDMPEFGDKVATPFTNLLTAKEYLETSQSDVQWRDRLWTVIEDTFTVNGASELGGELGSFGAGAAANKMADKYMEEMVETSFTLKASEKLNQRIYQKFVMLLQFLTYAQQLDFKIDFLGDTSYRTVHFRIDHFLKFQNPTLKSTSYYKLKKARLFFEELQKQHQTHL